MNSNIKIISVTANIAAGKTLLMTNAKKLLKTNKYSSSQILLERFCYFVGISKKKLPSIVFIKEPTCIWMNTVCENGKNIFENYYTNPSKWSFYFQLLALTTRIDVIRTAIKRNPQATTFVIERSPDDDFFIFATKLHEQKFISNDEMLLINMYRTQWKTEFEPLVKHVVYLNTDVGVCLSRKKGRCRPGEDGVDEELLKSLEAYSNNYIEMVKCKRGNEFVIELDGSMDKDSLDYSNMVCNFIDCLIV